MNIFLPDICHFQQIGGSFIKEYRAEFGTNHIYNADTFNEMTPRSSDPEYLSSASRAVYHGMLAGDPDAIWLMQGWLFLETSFWKPQQVKALLHGLKQPSVLGNIVVSSQCLPYGAQGLIMFFSILFSKNNIAVAIRIKCILIV